MDSEDKRRCFGRTETAAYLSVSKRYIDRLAATKALRSFKLGRRLMFDKADIDAFVEKLKSAA